MKDTNPSGTDDVAELVVHKGSLYFRARDSMGEDLWKTDGTAKGAKRIMCHGQRR